MSKVFTWLRYAAATAAIVLALIFLPGAGVDVQAAAVKGIDVSVYQGNIDWNAVASSDVKFAMVRVGNTKYGLDSNFAKNVINANAAGIRVGVYCYTYAKTPAEAAADAQLAIAAMANFPISFPVAIDIEDPSLRGLTAAQQQEIVNTFCQIVYAAGYHPMVYASRNWYLERLGQTVWDQWVAQYNSSCDYPGGYTMWQASSNGTVSGIAGNVDIDYLFKDYFSQIPASGLLTLNGKTYYYSNYRKQFGMQNIGGLMYGFDGTGAMIKDQTVTDAAGNIYRYCKDGRVVVITIQAQQAAAQAQAVYEQTLLLLTQSKALNAQYKAAADQANAALAAAQAQAQELQAQAAAIMGQAQVLPTAENLAAADLSQQAYISANAILEAAKTQAAAAGADLVNSDADVAAKTAALTAAKAASDTAAAAIVIPQ